MAKSKKESVDINKDILDLYDSVSRGFWVCSEQLEIIKCKIETCSELSKQRKKALLSRLQMIVGESNVIVNTIASIGKLK